VKTLSHAGGKPQVIFLDAVGTLFGVRGSVGTIYTEVAGRFGVETDPVALDRAFNRSFKAKPPFAVPEDKRDRISQYEFDWWKALAYETFGQAEVLNKFNDFEGFFAELYRVFATADTWFLYEDALPSLQYWQEEGIKLGIISNFDSRIFSVLESLGLGDFFSSITISSLTGVAKPDRKIFEQALSHYGCLPSQAWHIGDSLREDYEGAKAVGIIPFLVDPNR